jgi:ABC-type lipoprotein export system ATPase subunit
MPNASSPVIEAKGLYHIYRETEVETVALRGADLALGPASWTSLMGPSGSGKSTLVHVMGGLLEPSGGSVMIDGQDLTRLPPPERARRRRTRIGVVLQRDNLHPLLDVADNVALPLRLGGRHGGEIRDRVGELLRAIGLADWGHFRVGQLSGGEAQRVAIAVALAPRPAVLLADEPTGDLDEQTADSLHALLREMHQAYGLTSIIATHNPRLANACDRVLRLEGGRLIPA